MSSQNVAQDCSIIHIRAVLTLLLIIIQYVYCTVPYPLPNATYNWDFEQDGNADSKEGLKGNLMLEATVENGYLLVDGGYMRTEPIPTETQDHTLLVWVKLNHLYQKGGGVMNIQRTDLNQFNGIVFGESSEKEWMFGSENHRRWSPIYSHGVKENEADYQYVYVAINSKKQESNYILKSYRNGEILQDYIITQDKLVNPWLGGLTDMVFGYRQTEGPCSYCKLRGQIAHAMFFQASLSDYDVEKFQHQITVCFNECEICQDGYGCIKCKDSSKLIPDCTHSVEGWFVESVNPNTYKRNYQECNRSCKSCDGPTKNNCLSCQTDIYYYRKPLQNKRCDCQEGYYDNNINSLCKICNPFCKTCYGPNINNCLSCESTEDSHRILLQGWCKCEDKYYDDGIDIKCKPCHPLCATCYGGNQVQHCKYCIPGYSIIFIGGFCDKCHYSCQTCSGTSSNCISCSYDPNDHRIYIQGKCKCYNRYYDDGSNVKCQSCHEFCNKCSGGNTASHCTECKSGYYMNFGTCIKCPNNCITCSNASTCLSCSSDPEEKRKPQPSPQGKCECIDNYFEEQTSNKCLECHSSCSKCEGGNTSSHCTECKPGYFINSGSCTICLHPCITCSSASICLSCTNDPENKRNLLKQGKCGCQDSYYDDGINQQCQKCSPQCLTCENSPKNCVKCKQGKNKSGIIPNCGCSQSFFDDGQGNCKECPSWCLECTSEDICTKCINQNMIGTKCIQPKDKPYTLEIVVDGKNTIEKCSNKCKKCAITPDNCIECQPYDFRSQAPPKCSCQKGYHDENGKLSHCIPCPLSCLECVSSKQCISCNSNLNRVLNIFNGECECKPQHKQQQNSVKCYQCYSFLSKCFFKCPKGTIENNKTYTCENIIIQMNQNSLIYILCGLFIVCTQIGILYFTRYILKKKMPIQNQEFQQQTNVHNTNNNLNNSYADQLIVLQQLNQQQSPFNLESAHQIQINE